MTVDTSQFLRIKFWVAIETKYHAFSYSQKMFILHDLPFLHKGVESLIFKLEMCVDVFINKIVRQYLCFILYHFRQFIQTTICNMIKPQFSLPKSRINEYS